MVLTWAERLQFGGFKFDQYRTARWNGLSDNEAEDWREVWELRRLPFAGAARQPRPGRMRHRNQPIRAHAGERPGLMQFMPLDNDDRDIWELVRDRYRTAQEYFFDNPRGLTLVKALGYGGNGLVIKCEYKRDALAPILTFVLKMALTDWDASEIYDEEVTTEKFNRAAHIVQVIPRSKVGMPEQTRHILHTPLVWEDSSTEEEDSGDDSYGDEPTEKVLNARKSRAQQQTQEDRQARERRHARRQRRLRRLTRRRRREMLNPNPDPRFQVDRKDFLLLEFIENGDLEGFLKRVDLQEKDIPNRVLWAFWLCLTQACLGMQYPPRKFHAGRHEAHPVQKPDGSPDYDISAVTGKRLGEDLFEKEPAPRRRWAVKRWVHFDLDIKNILIGSLDVGTAGDNEHVLVLRLKVADFGLANEVKPNKTNVYYNTLRHFAKWGHFAPEQFGAEWDYIKRKPKPPAAPAGAPAGGAPPPVVIVIDDPDDDDDPLIKANGDEISEQPIAGNYGSHTNVWCIGLVSQLSLLTYNRLPTPSVMQHIVY
ncbi:hypothetical protein NPX13_g9655 [Xylaria arbuscula]|uniref:Protein kinase domain-containing protein n=1 Tax=Xylaria arbuscula TaxID=114810 RepID=A0A9W8N6B2_9PEZI|nr:hypothetical protein NPX13_g9655 [Xylaria arbuscula]